MPRSIRTTLGPLGTITLRLPVPSKAAQLLRDFQLSHSPSDAQQQDSELFYGRFFRLLWEPKSSEGGFLELPEDPEAAWEILWNAGVSGADCFCAVLDWAEAVKAQAKAEAEAVAARTAHFQVPERKPGSGHSASGADDRKGSGVVPDSER